MKRLLYLISIMVLTCYAIDGYERELELQQLSLACTEAVTTLQIVNITVSQTKEVYTLVSYLSKDLTPCMSDAAFLQKVLVLD